MISIGILGSGIVAQTLGKGFLKYGYTVSLGTRNPDKLNEWSANDGKGASVKSFADTAADADIIILAVTGRAASDALDLAGADNLTNKTIIDATNPIDNAGPTNGVLPFFTSLEESLMEQLQASYPKARFVKAFNSVGSAFMVDPSFELKPTMFICGNDEGAKEETTEILDQFGWETEDMGSVEAARAIEPLCMLWCIPGFRENRWSHAFKLLKS